MRQLTEKKFTEKLTSQNQKKKKRERERWVKFFKKIIPVEKEHIKCSFVFSLIKYN